MKRADCDRERYKAFKAATREAARDRGLLGLEHDEKSGGNVITRAGNPA